MTKLEESLADAIGKTGAQLAALRRELAEAKVALHNSEVMLKTHQEWLEQCNGWLEAVTERLDLGTFPEVPSAVDRICSERDAERAEAKEHSAKQHLAICQRDAKTEKIVAERDAARAEAGRLRDALAATCGALIEASAAIEHFNPKTMTTASLRYVGESCKLTAKHYTHAALATLADDASGEGEG